MRLLLKPAFTIVDLLLVMGLVTIVFSLTSVNLLGLQNKPSLATSVQKLAVDLKGQQNRAMVGDASGGSVSYAWGVYIEPARYTLFRGTIFVVSDPYSFVVTADPNMTLATSFANSTIVFNKRSGEVNNYSLGANSITVTNTASGESKTVTLNSLGAMTVN